jgi:hypothetical protein
MVYKSYCGVQPKTGGESGKNASAMRVLSTAGKGRGTMRCRRIGSDGLLAAALIAELFPQQFQSRIPDHIRREPVTLDRSCPNAWLAT